MYEIQRSCVEGTHKLQLRFAVIFHAQRERLLEFCRRVAQHEESLVWTLRGAAFYRCEEDLECICGSEVESVGDFGGRGETAIMCQSMCSTRVKVADAYVSLTPEPTPEPLAEMDTVPSWNFQPAAKTEETSADRPTSLEREKCMVGMRNGCKGEVKLVDVRCQKLHVV